MFTYLFDEKGVHFLKKKNLDWIYDKSVYTKNLCRKTSGFQDDTLEKVQI